MTNGEKKLTLSWIFCSVLLMISPMPEIISFSILRETLLSISS